MTRIALKAVDLDGDGEREVILCNEHLYAVVSPAQGGRLVYLFARTPGGVGAALVIGNPTDDWNLQEELNRYMMVPPNHPGALSDVGFEHDRYKVSAMESGTRVFLEMTNVQKGSRLFGARKRVLLSPDASELVVSYELPDRVSGLDVESCLSPDYHRLLREGRQALAPCDGEAPGITWRGFRNGSVAVWLGLDRDEETAWAEPSQAEAGHGLNVCVETRVPHFHLLIGCGEADEDRCRRLFEGERNVFHQMRELARTNGHRNHNGRPVTRDDPSDPSPSRLTLG